MDTILSEMRSGMEGICRIFPLGRYYEDDGNFRYFLQIHECANKTRAKVKVKKWIDTPQPAEYDTYIIKWHRYLKELRTVGLSRDGNAVWLKEFYLRLYDAADLESFY